jgi:hypothetical protein
MAPTSEWVRQPATTDAGPLSIAVLPFQNLTGDANEHACRDQGMV